MLYDIKHIITLISRIFFPETVFNEITSTNILTKLRLWTTGVQVPPEAGYFSLHHPVQSGSGSQLALLSNKTAGV
jgi:hypothetical protein